MVRKQTVMLMLLTVLMAINFSIVSAQSADIGYIINGKPDNNILDVFDDMGLSVDIIEDSDVTNTNLNQYNAIFVGDGRVRNTARSIDVSKFPSVIMNRHYGEEFGLTDRDGISQLGSSSPLKIRRVDNNRVQQVYTQASLGGTSIPYYYLDDHNKANVDGIARTFTGTEFELGDVVASLNSGTRLINGRTTNEKMCFFGIAKTDFWTTNAEILFEECVAFVLNVCSSNAECNDNDNHTFDQCINPGTMNAFCQNTPIECLNDGDCNDFDGNTIDTCHNPGTINSFCTNENIECFSKADCGIDGFVGNEFCSLSGDVVQDFETYSCNNPGTAQSFCSSETSELLVEICSEECSNGECLEIECVRDSDCNDSDSGTLDTCHLPGSVNSFCTNEPIECFNDLDCTDNDSGTKDTCHNPGETNSFCTNEPIECDRDSDCGIDGFVGGEFCSDNDVTREFVDYTCNSPGTINSFCSSTSEDRVIEMCTDICASGECVDIECSSDLECNDGDARTIDECVNPGTSASFCRNNEVNCLSDLDCGFTGFTGGEFCTNNDVHKQFQTAECMNAGTLNSFCEVEISPNLLQICDDNNLDTIDSCEEIGDTALCIHEIVDIECHVDSDCNDNDRLTLDKCNNPGTPDSICSNTPVQCTADADCGGDICESQDDFCRNGNIFNRITCTDHSCLSNVCLSETESELFLVKECELGCVPVTGGAACREDFGCETDSECNDNHNRTIDKCNLPGTIDAFCTNRPVECFNDAECGTDRFVGQEYCSIDGNSARDFVEFTCNNPGTAVSFCTDSIIQEVIEHCENSCFDGECLEIECENDFDCDDNNLRTVDQCVNPGDVSSFCSNTEINCLSDLDCGFTGFVGGEFCSADNLHKQFQTAECKNAGTLNSFCEVRQEPREIASCGVDSCGEFGANTCRDGNVVQIRSCFDRGCSDNGVAQCVSEIEEDVNVVELCENGCQAGACVPIEALSCEITSQQVFLSNDALNGGNVPIDFTFTGDAQRYRIIVGNYDGSRGNPNILDEGIDELELCGYGPEREAGLELPIDNVDSGRQSFNCIWNDNTSVFRPQENNLLVPGDYWAKVVLYDTPLGSGESDDVATCTAPIVWIDEPPVVEELSCEITNDLINLPASSLNNPGDIDIEFRTTGDVKRHRVVLGSYDNRRGNSDDQNVFESIDELELCGVGPQRSQGLEEETNSNPETFNCNWDGSGISVFHEGDGNLLVPGTYGATVVVYGSPVGSGETDDVAICNKKVLVVDEYTTPALCGNGILDSSEQCDDGNLRNGDGCSRGCTLEGHNPMMEMTLSCTNQPQGFDVNTNTDKIRAPINSCSSVVCDHSDFMIKKVTIPDCDAKVILKEYTFDDGGDIYINGRSLDDRGKVVTNCEYLMESTQCTHEFCTPVEGNVELSAFFNPGENEIRIEYCDRSGPFENNFATSWFEVTCLDVGMCQ
jgi:cysteine-rich repeat protein